MPKISHQAWVMRFSSEAGKQSRFPVITDLNINAALQVSHGVTRGQGLRCLMSSKFTAKLKTDFVIP